MKNEIVFKNINMGMKVAEMLLNEDYVVLLSREDNFLVVNFEFASGANRNEVVFMQRDEYEEETDKICDNILDDIATDIKRGISIESILGNRLK